MRPRLLGFAFAAATACAHSPSLHDRLVAAASAPDGQGRVAVTVLDLSTGTRASIHGDAPMPMMSVFKLGLAVVALDAVDHRRLRLDQPVPMAESDLRGDDFPSWKAWKDGQRSPTLETLLSWMVEESDNAAADKVFALLGGGAAITARLRALGIEGMQIAEPELAISARLACPGIPPPDGGWTEIAVDACPKLTEEQEVAAALREIQVSRNDATTDGIVDLLARMGRGAILGNASRDWLLNAMARSTTGPRRLRGLLPAGTSVAHKTGTAAAGGVSIAINDVGIVTAPDGKRFAIAVMISGSHAKFDAQEEMIARLAWVAWDALRR